MITDGLRMRALQRLQTVPAHHW